MMIDGKKATCVRIVYEALDLLKSKTDKEPLEVFLKALDISKWHIRSDAMMREMFKGCPLENKPEFQPKKD